MAVRDAVRNFLIRHAMDDYTKYTEEELEVRRNTLEKGLMLVLKPYLIRKEFPEIYSVLDEMILKVDHSIYDPRYAEKVKKTLARVLNWCHAWEKLW